EVSRHPFRQYLATTPFRQCIATTPVGAAQRPAPDAGRDERGAKDDADGDGGVSTRDEGCRDQGRAQKHIAKARGSRDLGDSDKDRREHERADDVIRLARTPAAPSNGRVNNSSILPIGTYAASANFHQPRDTT